MKKYACVLLFVSALSGFAQNNLLGQSGFDSLMTVSNVCSEVVNSVAQNCVDCPESEQEYAVSPGSWFRCGPDFSVHHFNGNHYGVFSNNGTSYLRQLLDGLTVGFTYRVTLKLSKNCTAQNNEVVLEMKPQANVNAASLVGWSLPEIVAGVRLLESTSKVAINPAAISMDHFETFSFLFTAAQTSMILQIYKPLDEGSPSNANVYLDDVSVVSLATNALLETAQHKRANEISYLPNPTTDFIRFSAPEIIDQLSVYNLLGEQVASSELNATDGTIDVSGLPRGMYIISAKMGDTSKSFKAILQ